MKNTDFDNYNPIEGKPNLVKDPNTNAILNVDEDAYNEYIETYKKVYSEKQRINSMESEVQNIKNDLNEIKELLKLLSQNK